MDLNQQTGGGLVVAGDLFASDSHDVDQQVRTQAPINGNTFAIQTIHESDEIIKRANLSAFREVEIAHYGEFAKRPVDKMGRNIADGPAMPRRLAGPIRPA